MRIHFLILLAALAGCAQANFYRKPTEDESRTLLWENDLTLDEQVYLLGIRDEPVTFDLSGADADAAWERARRFVRTYSSMKIRRSDGGVIRTEARVAPAGVVPVSCDAGYLVTRDRKGNVSTFTIKTSVSAPDWVPCEIGRRRNARILSRYMRTGALRNTDLIQK